MAGFEIIVFSKIVGTEIAVQKSRGPLIYSARDHKKIEFFDVKLCLEHKKKIK